MAGAHLLRKLGLDALAADPPGTEGDDLFTLVRGTHDILAGAGQDAIYARHVAASVLDGEGGNDFLRLAFSDAGSILRGGEGNDIIRLRETAGTVIEGGAGDDRIVLDAASAAGTVIVDSEGLNRLVIRTDQTLAFHREAGGHDLQIILDGGTSFDPTHDLVWKDFFDNPLNRVNGMTTKEIAALAPEQTEPLPLGPTVAQMVYASEAAYSRAETGLPEGLQPFAPGGTPLETQVTLAGLYARALETPDHQVIVAFEGTDIHEISTRTAFVDAQIAADAAIYLGLTPIAFDLGVTFAQSVIAAAALDGIPADHVYVTGHSLGAGIAMYVGAQLDMAGMTFAAPGIAGAAIPPGQPSQLVNYVEYGDPIGNYSANPAIMGPFLQSDQILRYGAAEYLGDPLAGAALALDSAVFGPGSTDAEKAAALTALGVLADTYHPLSTYAGDLGISLPPTSYDPADLAAALPVFVAAVIALGGTIPGADAVVA